MRLEIFFKIGYVCKIPYGGVGGAGPFLALSLKTENGIVCVVGMLIGLIATYRAKTNAYNLHIATSNTLDEILIVSFTRLIL